MFTCLHFRFIYVLNSRLAFGNLYEIHQAESMDKHEPVSRLINSLDNIRIIVG